MRAGGNSNSPESSDVEDEGVPLRPFDSPVVELNDGRSLQLGDTIFQWHNASGWGTFVSRATIGSKDVVLKCSWPAQNRTPEAQMVNTAAQFARGCGESWVLNHLPKVLHSEEREFGADSPQYHLSHIEGASSHLLRIVIQEELHPITDLSTAAELGEAFRGIFRCYRWLYEHPRIMHCDISLNNLIRLEPRLLVDIETTHRNPALYGTGPSYAWSPSPHLYRFDLESLFYVMVVISCSYEDGEEIENPPFDEWEHLGSAKLWNQKSLFFCNLVPPPTPGFVGFNNLNQSLAMLFVNGFRARRSHELRASLGRGPATGFDHVTLGGHVTFDTFERTLEEHLPPLTKTSDPGIL
ncbi:hypothetical protein K438DRAFT_2021435 [Mycena galopus ATCC 62051]|nr:hypothetical protein K438DRAFT_2021435 [Mycena galopus ATCC 62051]